MPRERKEYYCKYYAENRERILEEQKKCYQKNRDRKQKYQREYSKKKKQENLYWQTRKTHMNFARENGYSFEELESWYKQQWMKQQAQCAICGKVFSDDEVIDHYHETNELRGLLCTPCNVGIGMFKDSPELCINASNYLNRKDKKWE